MAANRQSILPSVAVLLILAAAALVADRLRPQTLASRTIAPFRLESIVPETFADWHEVPDDSPILPSPELQAAIDKVYEQTVERTYVDSRGRSIMLSIAYSANYDKGMQWHRPEHCYPSQGFTIDRPTEPLDIHTPFGSIEASRLVARRGERVEPITYWFILGAQQARFGFDLRWRQVWYGLTGQIPTGLLVRVSSINRNIPDAFALQDQFSREMVEGLRTEERNRFLGAHSVAVERSGI
jgi:EpsI family protein